MDFCWQITFIGKSKIGTSVRPEIRLMVPWDIFFFRLIFLVGYFKILQIIPVLYSGASQVPLVVQTLPANAEDIRDMCSIPELERSPEEGTAIHSSILAWRILWVEEPGRLPSIEVPRVEHD